MAVPVARSAAAAWLTLALHCACGGGPDAPAAPPTPAADGASGPIESGESLEQEWFTDAAAESGLDFVHFSGASGELLFPEIMGSGVALLDYDNDGDLDAYFAQGRMLAADPTVSQALFPVEGPLPPSGRLYRNDLRVDPDGTRTPRFADVTAASGIAADGYGMGVAAGDIDNDGWGVSAAFVDYDRDGWLDLYVGNYVHYSVDTDITCPSTTGGRDYCPPRVYRAQPDRLYRNQGGE